MKIINTNIINNNFQNISNSNFNNVNKTNKIINNDNKSNEVKSFEDVLKNQEQNNVQFSKHASMRLGNREINLSNSQIKRVESGIEKAKQKGINDSLILVDNIALLVNVKKNLVITAIPNDTEKVYTNIDGAVIV